MNSAAGSHHPPPWISILIPVYNVAPYVTECIASIASQMSDGVEVIALDDGSTDGSLELLEEQRRQILPQLKIERHALNQGISAARNHLMAAASGDYLWFVDSDDMLVPGAIAAARRIVEHSRPDMIGCDYFRHYRPRRLTGANRGLSPKRTFRGPHRRLTKGGEPLIHGTFTARKLYLWSRIFRRELHPVADLFPTGRCFEDAYALPRLFLLAQSYYHEPTPWVIYRERPSSISRTTDQKTSADLAYSLSGMHAEFTPALRQMGGATQYAVAIYCASTFVRSLRTIAGLDRQAVRLWHGQILAHLRPASPLSARQFLLHSVFRPLKWRTATKFAFWYRLPEVARRLKL